MPRPGEDMNILVMQVYPNSFAALGTPLVAGRDFSPQDVQQWMSELSCQRGGSSAPPPRRVGIINESMARRFFKNENPIGRRFGFASFGWCGPEELGWIEIIGVARDVKYTGLRNETRAMYYLPFHQADTGRGQMTLVVRTVGEPTSVAAAVRREARAMIRRCPCLKSRLWLHKSRLRCVRNVSSRRSPAALACWRCCSRASVSTASCLTPSRNERIEIGVRMALGADRRDVLWLVLRDALRLVLLGVALGIPATLAAARLIASQLFGITAADPAAIGLATLVLLGVAAVAGYLPARRATRVDPLVALRGE